MKNKKGFTLVELLVVIAIIGLLATIAFISLNSARGKARDAKRVSDVRTMQSTLELYFNDQQTPSYPISSGAIDITTSWGSLVPSYASVLPVPPTPVDGTCAANDNRYRYQSLQSGASYSITFCIGSATGGINGGCVVASPSGLVSGGCI